MRTWLTLMAIVGIVLLWLATPYIARCAVGPENTGTLGDTFGAVNALFSGLAFAGLILAITLQRDELKLQREELALTRAELTRPSATSSCTSRSPSTRLKGPTSRRLISIGSCARRASPPDGRPRRCTSRAWAWRSWRGKPARRTRPWACRSAGRWGCPRAWA